MKMKYNFTSKIEKFFSNKMLLNVIVGISFLNIIAFVMLNQTVALIYFIIIGLVTSFFSKNMNIVLLVPLILVNLFVATSKSMHYKREGLENKADSDKEKTDKTENTNSKDVTTTKKKPTTSSSSTNQGLPITPLDHPQDMQNNTLENKTEIDESFEVGRSKKNSKGYNIDYASTVEDAYDELNKILGSDGIKRLTSDTQSLMKQQMKLAESMKDMQPLIAGMGPIMKQAEGLLGSMSQSGNLGDLAKIAKNFTAATSGNSNQ
jgi:hypothetical protein